MNLIDSLVLNKIAENILNIYRNELVNLNKVASGNLLESLDYKILEDENKFTIQIEALDYIEYVDKGRRPGKFPPLSAISQWARERDIPQKAVFPIAKKIADEGITPTNVIKKSEDKINLNEIFNQVEENFILNINQILDGKLKQFKNIK